MAETDRDHLERVIQKVGCLFYMLPAGACKKVIPGQGKLCAVCQAKEYLDGPPTESSSSDRDIAMEIIQTWDHDCSEWVKPFHEWDKMVQRDAIRMLAVARRLLYPSSETIKRMGSKGGKATAAKMTKAQRKTRAQNAAKVRWANREEKK